MKSKCTLLVIATVLLITIFSCKKTSNNSSDKNIYLQGYWQGTLDTSYGFGLLIKPGNACRLYINPTAATLDTTNNSIPLDETWSVTNNVLTITGQNAQCSANLIQDKATLTGTFTAPAFGSGTGYFSVTKQ
ncbi:MAG TPA: hypothetical protein VFF57_03350 [Hanamia sp.]|nr:hypothetical protein [Hanamia sp.]